MDTLLEQQLAGNEVPCLILPITNGQLLLPTVTVAEMIPYRKPEPKIGESLPTWFLGFLPWRGLSVPMLSFEAINGQKPPTIHEKRQISILNNTGINPRLPFLAIPTTGIPHLSRIKSGSIKRANVDPKPHEVMHVNIDDEVAIIPDVSSLERACAKLLEL